ncbi:hypothetical protein [Flammeovirga sp. SJP92]|uniref:hypothetical protein n=1 Tax=Flammeovirga sp. SJP92 TaxID=1775430 RepID=UPI000786E690|nr:hypothetical protein [Flammeovirga sp. SJP92]KXX68678.1 hypothetical protein AVL50_23255 [Flammeovirga sp. SJP92]
MLRSFYLTLQILILFTSSYAQKSQKLWENEEALQCATSIMDALYKCDFETSDSLMLKYADLMNGHSSTALLKGLNVYWKNVPFDYENDESVSLLFDYLDRCIELCEKSYNKDASDFESIYFLLLARSMKARTYNYKGATWKAVSEAREVYSLTRKGMKNLERFDEFNFSSGIYNYYREFYPELNPIYKPFLSFFPSGNKDLGIQQLEFAEKHSIFTSTEAGRYLMWIYTRNNNPKAVNIAYQFLNKYPNNQLFIFESLITLNFNGEFKNEKVLQYIALLENSHEEFNQVGGLIMKGVYYFENADYEKSNAMLSEADQRLQKLESRKEYIDSPLYAYLYALNVVLKQKDLSKFYKRKATETEYGVRIIDHLNKKQLSRL